jgi:hypothetical protein
MIRRACLLAVLCFATTLWVASAAHAQCTSGSNCQIVLSGTGLGGLTGRTHAQWM